MPLLSLYIYLVLVSLSLTSSTWDIEKEGNFCCCQNFIHTLQVYNTNTQYDMARYYCDYCHSYLTHDTLSVRKSHLIGKNHLRITADYYRNKHVQQQQLAGRSRKQHNKKHSEHGKQSSVKVHCLTRKEKRLQRKTQASHRKQLQASHTTLQDDLSKIYYGSPGYSKIWIDKNRFDICDLVKIAGVPKRANVTATTIDPHSIMSQQHRDHVYSQRDIVDKPAQLQLQPPMILQQWSNTVPKYTTYNDTGSQLRHTIEIVSRKRTRHDDSSSSYTSSNANGNKRFHPAQRT